MTAHTTYGDNGINGIWLMERAHPVQQGPPHDRWGPRMGASGPLEMSGPVDGESNEDDTDTPIQLVVRYAAATGTPKSCKITAAGNDTLTSVIQQIITKEQVRAVWHLYGGAGSCGWFV